MSCLAHSGGHNAIIQGANSIWGKEHAVVRDFLATVDKYVRLAGWETVNCTDDVGRTQENVWGNSGRKHLQVKHSNIDLQYHLNATLGGTGCEVLYKPGYGNKEKAAQLSAAIAKALGIRDRGAKERSKLGWLNTTKTGLMVEICFVDNKSDMDKLYANWDAAARAVAEVVTGKSISGGNSTPAQEKWTNENNPYDGSYGTIEAVGGGVNTYTSPYADGQYVKTIHPGTTYHAYVEKDEYFGIGYNEWVAKKYIDFRQYLAIVTPVGNVNVYDSPSWNGAYRGEVQAGVGYTVYAEKDGWYLLAGNVWIDGQYVMIKK